MKDTRGLKYLEHTWGIREKGLLEEFCVGYVNGTLLEVLPSEGDVIEVLKRMGVLTSRGQETLYHCVTIPLRDLSNAIVGLYGKKIEPKEGASEELFLPSPPRGILNWQAAKRSQSLLLTPTILEGLRLYQEGFRNTMPCYGKKGPIQDHFDLFTRFSVKETYCVHTPNDAGKGWAREVETALTGKGLRVYPVELPEKDVVVYFKRHTPEEFEELLKAANPKSLERSDLISKREEALYEESPVGFRVAYGGRLYEVKGIQRQGTQLKATIKASKHPPSATSPFELSTIDLYSHRSREGFARLLSGLFTEKVELLQEDLQRLLLRVEGFSPVRSSGHAIEPTGEERDEALRFLKSPSLLTEVLQDLETLGYTGEQTNKTVGFLAAVSRKLEEPLSLVIQSRSAAGKSALQEALLSLLPPEDYVKYTRLTDQALFYKEEDSLVHKILALEEARGMGGASYSIRAIQSSGQILVASTAKDSLTGKMKTYEYRVKGPAGVWMTTAQTELDQEMLSRCLTLSIDESQPMTERILKKQREEETLEGLLKKVTREKLLRKHQAAQRLLKPLRVVNPYASHLLFPSESLRARRDQKKYFALIKAVALLHQHQREIKTVAHQGEEISYIEVTLEDIETATRLARPVLERTAEELSPPSRTLLSIIRDKVTKECAHKKIEPREYPFTRRMVREWAGWSDWQVREHLKELVNLEFLRSRQGSWGREYLYELSGEEGPQHGLQLPDIEALRERVRIISSQPQARAPHASSHPLARAPAGRRVTL